RGVTLDKRGQADRFSTFDEPYERVLFERHGQQQRKVGAAGPGLPQLVAADDEVLAQDGRIDGGPDGLQIVQRPAEAPWLGQDASRGRPTGLVLAGQRGRVGYVGECALRRTRPLDLGDDGDTRPAKRRHGVSGRWLTLGGR